MWCNHCQQDVPGVATLGKCEGTEICCARCGEMIATRPVANTVFPNTGPRHSVEIADHGLDLCDSPAKSSDVNAAILDAPPVLTLEDWALESQLERITTLAGQDSSVEPDKDVRYQEERGRVDPEHDSMAGWHPGRLKTSVGRPDERRAPPAQPSPPRAMSTLSLGTIALGTATFLCGGVLLGWSLVDGYSHLWSLGLPITLCGQLALLVGLVMLLERLWSDNRRTSTKIDDANAHIADLKNSTRMLGVAHGSASQAFYAHMAEGASEELLLADLKGQLDLLAVRMAQRG